MKNFGTKSKLIVFLKKYYKSILLFSCLLILNIIFLCINYETKNLSFGKNTLFLLLGSVFLEILFCTVIYIAKKKSWKIETIFLILGLSIGLLYVFALPPGRAPDGSSHYYRIYEISSGNLISDISNDGAIGSMEPTSISLINDYVENNVTYSDIANDLDLRTNEDDKSFMHTSAYSYNIISYLPHTIGMLIGNLLNLPFLITAYIAKIFNLLACILILYFCIKYIPILKKVLLFLAFLPVTMQAMASLSPDGFTIATSISLISFVLFSIYSKQKKFSSKQLVLLFTICLCLSMCKIAYAPLCLLIFAIPKECFGNQKNKLITIFSFGIIIFLIMLIWILIAPSVQSAYDSASQTSLILSNPPKYVAILVHSLSTNANLYLYGFLGGYLEWFNVVLSPIYLIAGFTIFILLCDKETRNITTTKTLKILSILIFVLITTLTFTTMFIQWTKVGETIIDGVQGRYFLPIALLIPIWFIPTEKTSSKAPIKSIIQKNKLSLQLSQNYYLYGFIVFESIYAITTIACAHL